MIQVYDIKIGLYLDTEKDWGDIRLKLKLRSKPKWGRDLRIQVVAWGDI